MALPSSTPYQTALQAVITGLAANTPLSQLLPEILAHAQQLLHTSHGFIDLAEPGEALLERKFTTGLYQQWQGAHRQWGEGLSGYVWQNGQAMVVENYDTWAGRTASIPLGVIRAAIAVPIPAPAQVLGVLGLAYGPHDAQPPEAFAPALLAQLSQLAQLAAIAINTSQLLLQNREAGEFTDGLYQAALSISRASTSRDICQNLAIHFNAIVQADRTLMYLVDHAQKRITLRVGAGNAQEKDFTNTYAELTAGPSGQVFRSGQPLLVTQADFDEMGGAAFVPEGGSAIGEFIVAPIVVNNQVIGSVTTLNRSGQRPFTHYHTETLMTLATLAATAIDNTRLFEETRQANEILARRAMQLLTSNLVGQQLTSILDPEELLTSVVTLIQNHFGYYTVSVWLLNTQRDLVQLQALAGVAGQALPIGMRLSLEVPSLITEVSQAGQARTLDSVLKAPNNPVLQALADIRSEATFPLRVGERVLGALDLTSEKFAAFGTDDQLVLQTLADQISIALRNAQLYADQKKRRHLAETLEQMGRELSSTLDLSTIPGRILTQLAAVIPYAVGLVILREHGELTLAAQQGFPEPLPVKESVLLKQAFVQQVLASAQPLRIADVTATPEFNPLPGYTEQRAWLGVPLLLKSKATGLIALARPEPDTLTIQDATLVAAFAGQAAIALENARLYDETSRFSDLMERMVEARTAELHQAIAILEKLDKTKASFIEVSAHELRTPLTVIKGYASMLNSFPFSKDPSIKPLLTSLLDSINRLHEIINTMLDATKIDVKKLDLRPEPVKLSLIVDRIVHEFRADLEARRLTINAVGIKEIPIFQASMDLLRKMLFQVVVNAIKYTPDGGTINITAEVRPESSLGGPAVEILVTDNGIGIDSEHHELIFEKLYTIGEVALHSSGRTKFKGGGPGLGLAIARGIANAHGGKIWVESAGHDEIHFPGSQFHILLPYTPLQEGGMW